MGGRLLKGRVFLGPPALPPAVLGFSGELLLLSQGLKTVVPSLGLVFFLQI